MDDANFAVEAEVEQSHWWFAGRRRLFARELTRAGIRPSSCVLDVGSGTGANLRMLQDMHIQSVAGLDSSELAIGYCLSKGLGRVQKGDVCAMPFDDRSFDFVIATDIIEHVDDDAAALRELTRVLKDGGKALIAVPAFPSLWSLQDIVAHHKRRLQLLLRKMREAEVEPVRYYHFNYLLFAPLWLARRLIGFLGIKRNSEAEFNSPIINRILLAIFKFDVSTAPTIRPPFGVSILAVRDHLQ